MIGSLVIALRHVEEALGLTPAHRKFPLHMVVMNVMDLLLLMKVVMFKNVRVKDVCFSPSSSC